MEKQTLEEMKRNSEAALENINKVIGILRVTANCETDKIDPADICNVLTVAIEHLEDAATQTEAIVTEN